MSEELARLLADVRAVFGLLRRKDGEIPTANLLSELHAREESPWKKLDGKRGEPLDARELARLLRPFGVKSKKLRVEDETPWGYVVSAFADPFERYLSPDTLSGTAGTAEQRNRATLARVKVFRTIRNIIRNTMTPPTTPGPVPDRVPDHPERFRPMKTALVPVFRMFRMRSQARTAKSPRSAAW